MGNYPGRCCSWCKLDGCKGDILENIGEDEDSTSEDQEEHNEASIVDKRGQWRDVYLYEAGIGAE